MTTTQPAPLLWTLDDYHRLIDTGLLAGRRVQLIEGQLIEMPPMNTPHIGAMSHLFHTLTSQLGSRVFSQTPITLESEQASPSEPEPDVYVAQSGASLKPPIRDVVLLIEVSDATVRSDRAHKVLVYTAAGAPEVWLVDLPGQKLEVWLDGRFARSYVRGAGSHITPTRVPEVTIDIDAIFTAAERP
jgi:Uma2 family endonuclease